MACLKPPTALFDCISDTLNELPSYIARGLVYLMLLFLAIVLVWASTSQIDMFATAPAVTVPEGKAMVIQPNASGIVKQIAVREGERVHEGQILVVIESEEVGKLLSELKDGKPRNFTSIEQEVHSQKILEASKDFELNQQAHETALEKLAEQILRLKMEIRYDSSRLDLQNKELEAHKKLRNAELESEMEWLEAQSTHQEAVLHLERNKSLLQETLKDREVMVRKFATIRAQHENILRILQEKLEQTIITSPADGMVSQLLIRNIDEVVSRGQMLMSLIPEGVAMMAELKISNKDIGMIKTGQSVKLKFDAFPAAEYGAIAGTLIKVLPDAEVDAVHGSFYRTFVSLDQTYFWVQGEKIPLRFGATATAEIKTEQRTILELMSEPFAELRKTKEALK